MVAASALSALSIAAQGLVDVRRSGSLQGPTSLYFLTVAESGERKSSLDGYFTRPIHEFECRAREAAKGAEADHAADYAVWEAERQAANNALGSAAKDGTALDSYRNKLSDIERCKPTPPRVPRIIYMDVTQEKLLRSLAVGWPSAAIVTSEGGAVFGAHAMRPDSVMRTLSALNMLWDATPIPVDRAGSESFTVRGARFSINVQVQPAVLSGFMEGAGTLARGSGLLARFLLSVPETRQGTRMFRESPSSWPALDAYNARIAALLSNPPNFSDDGRLEPVVLEFGHEAKAVWVRVHDQIERQIGPAGNFSEVRDVAAKAADNVARLAALLHMLDREVAYGQIGPEAIKSAAAVVMWHLKESKRFLGEVMSSPEAVRVAALDQWLRAHCRREGVTSVSTRTIQQYGPVRTRKALDEALAVLEEHSRVKVVSDGKRRVAVNPALLTDDR
jgi:putative DNA primase/helicase